jgi:Stage VI sporulation protein F
LHKFERGGRKKWPALSLSNNHLFTLPSYNKVVYEGAWSFNMDNGFFKNIEKKTGVNMKDIFDLANSLQNANFKDEATVRNVIRRVSQIANKPVNKDLEDQIVKSIIKDGKQLDFNTISKMMNKK